MTFLCPTLARAVALLCLSQPLAADTGEVVQSIIGRTLVGSEASHSVIHADGSLEGRYNGIAFSGKWYLDGDQYCREFTRGIALAQSCVQVRADRDAAGRIVGVIFVGDGYRTQFHLMD